LARRRDQLAAEVAELHWNLGGLTYEMAIRDHFRIDVLVRRAAMLQEREAELAEVERLLHMQEGSIAGACASCGAVRSRGAVFCWQCGAQVMERTVAPASDASAGEDAHSNATDAAVSANSHAATTLLNEGNGHPETVRPVVTSSVSRETTDAASRAITHADELSIGRPVPIP
jgi:uncharacterized Zn finger protein (UPF0148 family)